VTPQKNQGRTVRPSSGRRGKAVATAAAVAAITGGAARVEGLEPRVLMAFSASINFQPAGAQVPANYQADTGATYGARAGGLTYGWDASNSANTRDRNNTASPDQRYDTFAYTQRSRQYRWELAVPSGLYSVRVVAGDPSATDSVYGFNVEGMLTASGIPSATRRWIEGTVVVPVTDGRLTLTNAPAATNNKINFVTVAELVPQNLKAAAASDSTIALSWSDMSIAETAYRIERSTDGVNFSTLADVGANVLKYTDTGRTPGVTYTYRVRCLAVGGVSAPSNASAASIVTSPLQVSFGATGVSKVTYKGVTLFDLARNPSEGFQAYEIVLKKPDGTLQRLGGAPLRSSWNAAEREVTLEYAWGSIGCKFTVEGDQLRMHVQVDNASSINTVAAVTLSPMTFRFPVMPDAFFGGPKLGYNVNGPAVLAANYGSGQAVFVNEDVARPLTVGYSSNPTTAAQFNYNLLIGGARPDGPAFERPIAPGHSDTYNVAIRFGYAGVASESLATDINAKYAAAFPATLNWADRRPIGSIFLSDAVASGVSATNPHGWWGDPTVNTTTPAGLANFKKRFLADADRSINILRNMNAQGVIVWDVEGEQHQGATYIGDPRVATQTLPELGFEKVLDEYFRRFTTAGFRVGVTLRPTQFTATSATSGTQTEVADPAALMIEKARFARDRWGATLFYVDSNDAYRPQDISRLAAAFPDSLFIPEHELPGSYGFSAPYGEVRRNDLGTPKAARALFPGSFSVIEATMGVTNENRSALVDAVRAGDILIFQGWYDNPANATVKDIYDEVRAATLVP
jgi:hypothetical protein